MNFIEAIKFCIDNSYADFKSRASRSQFWYFTLFVVLYIGIGILILRFIIIDWAKIEEPLWKEVAVFVGYFTLVAPIVVPSFSVTVRRLHDINISGWYLGLYLAISYLDNFFGTKYVFYLISTIIFYSVCSLKGIDGKNRFGNKPLK